MAGLRLRCKAEIDRHVSRTGKIGKEGLMKVEEVSSVVTSAEDSRPECQSTDLRRGYQGHILKEGKKPDKRRRTPRRHVLGAMWCVDKHVRTMEESTNEQIERE